MASGIFAILDDISALMDDVAAASKIATQKTAGILGDDLAVNAEKATGFVSSRELPVLWKITKGSLLNKVIIVPIALLLNYFFPPALPWILLIGGAYLAFEGVEKIIHYFFAKKKETHTEVVEVDEATKVKSAIKTDFILSIEIVIIAMGTVLDNSIGIMITTVCVVSLLATVGVYGLVALIVRMDDFGYYLTFVSKRKGILNHLGLFFIHLLPWVIKFFAVIGTLALIFVAGGIFNHHIPYIHHITGVPDLVKEVLSALVIGLFLVALVEGFKKIKGNK